MLNKIYKKIHNTVKGITWPSPKEIIKVCLLVVSVILLLALPLYAIDMMAAAFFGLIRDLIWSFLSWIGM